MYGNYHLELYTLDIKSASTNTNSKRRVHERMTIHFHCIVSRIIRIPLIFGKKFLRVDCEMSTKIHNIHNIGNPIVNLESIMQI